MHHRTVTLSVDAGAAEVFAFLSDLRNLPAWATRLCRGVRRDGLRWLADAPGGELVVALRCDADTGVIDLFVGPTAEALARWAFRVLGGGDGCAITCTQIPPADLPEEFVERQFRARVAELRDLGVRFGGGALDAPGSAPVPFYPSLVTARLRDSVEFYTEALGFRVLDDESRHVQLAHPSGVHLGLLRHETDGQPAELINATDGRGFWLSLRVADVDAEHRRLRALGADVDAAPEDKPWGERVLVVRDPNGVLIHLSHPIVAPPPAVPWWVPADPEAFLARL